MTKGAAGGKGAFTLPKDLLEAIERVGGVIGTANSVHEFGNKARELGNDAINTATEKDESADSIDIPRTNLHGDTIEIKRYPTDTQHQGSFEMTPRTIYPNNN